MNNANGGNVIFHFKGDTSDLDKTTKSMGNMTKSILTATGITKALSAGFNMITNSMDSAIARYDTMNNFPRVMNNLGISSDEAEKSISRMSEALVGLPTTLDQGAMAVQRFTSANGDVAKSTDIFLAVNNAILAGGASAEIQSSALEQLSQAYAKGKPDMMEWRTLMTAMPAQLNQVANAMGYVSSSDLGEAVREDTNEFNRMIETIVQLNTTGVDGFANFEEQARASTKGISTGIKNMKSRVSAGVAEMISSVNKGLEANGLGGIAPMLENFGTSIKNFLVSIAPYLTQIIDFLVKNVPPILTFLQQILPFLTPILAFIITFNTYLKAMEIIKSITIAFQMFHAVLLANPIGIIIGLIVALVATFIVLWNKCEWFRNFWIGLWEGIKNQFLLVWNGIKAGFQLAIDFFVNAYHSVVNFFTTLPDKMKEVGLNVVKGIGKGITSGIDWIKKKIKEFVGNVTSFIKKIFKIGSPSKLMEKSVGQWIPKGIAVGISANTDSVYDSMQQLQESVLEGFSLDTANSLHYSPNVIVNNNISQTTDPLGQVITQVKTFANGAKNDYNYGMGVR